MTDIPIVTHSCHQMVPSLPTHLERDLSPSYSQVIKACVLAVEPGTGRLKLGLASSKKAASAVVEGGTADPYAGLEAGDLAEAVVKQVGMDMRKKRDIIMNGWK